MCNVLPWVGATALQSTLIGGCSSSNSRRGLGAIEAELVSFLLQRHRALSFGLVAARLGLLAPATAYSCN